MPSIDVVVPAYNEEKLISRCLNALTNQTYKKPYRIIVIDNNSTDNTKKIAEKFKNVIVKTEKRKGYVFSVKTGVETYSTAPIVALTDADSEVSPIWIQTIIENFKSDPDLVACGGPFYFTDGHFLFKYVVNGISYVFPRAFNYFLCGMNMAYKKSSYLDVGGYDLTTNLQADGILGKKLFSVGTVRFYREQYVYTTSRRYRTVNRFIKELYIQLANVSSIILRNKPLYSSNTDYRN